MSALVYSISPNPGIHEGRKVRLGCIRVDNIWLSAAYGKSWQIFTGSRSAIRQKQLSTHCEQRGLLGQNPGKMSENQIMHCCPAVGAVR